jgi:16S rRNA (adenine1518-N6/adenine1519-N6)-dimethyltransferase
MSRQKLGQHFLHDESVLDAIISAYCPTLGELIVEVGPGKGALTEKLLLLDQKVIGVEWDEEMLAVLRQKYSKDQNLILEHADIRHFNLINFIDGIGYSDYSIVANLPYYLSAYFMRQLFEYSRLPRQAILLIQKEVAERVIAKPGTKTRSTLSVLAQVYSSPKINLIVPPTSFTPPPQVESAVVSFEKIKNPFVNKTQEKNFFRVVKSGFSSKRKTLLNSLSAGLHMERDEIAQILQNVAIDANLRAESISVDQWFKLEAEIYKEK